MKISVAMPIHNETGCLPYSLASLCNAPIDELVILLDRCPDNSVSIVNKFTSLNHKFDVVLVEKNRQNWKVPIAEAFETAFNNTTGDVIYTMADDLITDHRIYRKEYFDTYDLVSFFYVTRSLRGFHPHEDYLNFLRCNVPTLRVFKPHGKITGLFAIKREMWERVHFRDAVDYDTLFWRDLLKLGCRHLFVRNVRNVHLRPALDKRRQFTQGFARAQINVHPLKVLLHSFFYIKPYVFVGYYHGKRHFSTIEG